METLPEHGMVHCRSIHSVAETLQRLEDILAEKGIPILARIDHSGAAADVGLQMKPTELLIFGNARAGTPLMLAAPTLALDLPLKVLVWEDPAGSVWAMYNSPEYLQLRHGVPDELMENISGGCNSKFGAVFAAGRIGLRYRSVLDKIAATKLRPVSAWLCARLKQAAVICRPLLQL
jgi:uncharacterized protein (DUF302 family)